MSDIIISSIIGAFATISVAIIARVWKSQKNDKQDLEGKVCPLPESIEQKVVSSEIVSQSTLKPRCCGLTHLQITDAIDKTMPYHRQQVHDGFVGQSVSWKVLLSSISPHGDSVIVTTSVPEGSGLLFCRSRREDCDHLMVAEEGTPLIVTGEIETISRYEFTLECCKYRIVGNECDG
jgi:hypothetical protein